ncbi:hypothetical protein WJM97_02135 [Okeanomitos corallinicola TIOX110]|uniref:Uncharacterized protein n=1 Tax=Okeanomitos corallinicola TIOX110 TaxID=3133117 RepID=A0ABZ2UTS2_9CYAN
MNIAKLIFCACQVFLASLLLVVNPAQASTKCQVIPNADQVVAVSVQATPELTEPIFHQQNHKVINHNGCGCSACVQGNLALLQGKLPVADF